MKIPYYKIQHYLKNLKEINNILIYGNCYNTITTILKRIVEDINYQNNFLITKLEFIKIIKEPELLFIELNNFSIFHKKKLIIILNASNTITLELQNILDNNIGDNFIIIISNELLKYSTLRNYYENSKHALSIACYQETKEHLSTMISQYLQKHQVQCSEQSLLYLCDCLSNNGSSFLSQMEKLLLYIGSNKYITSDDIDNTFFSEETNPTLDKLCIAVANNNINKFITLSKFMLYNKVSPIYLIRSISRYFLNLDNIIRIMKSGYNIDKALKSINPPIFFKILPTIRNHALNIPHKKIVFILKKLLEIEITIKKNNDLSQNTIFQHSMILILTNLKKL